MSPPTLSCKRTRTNKQLKVRRKYYRLKNLDKDSGRNILVAARQPSSGLTPDKQMMFPWQSEVSHHFVDDSAVLCVSFLPRSMMRQALLALYILRKMFSKKAFYLLLEGGLRGIDGAVQQHVAGSTVHLGPSHPHGGGLLIVDFHSSHTRHGD